MKIELFAIGLLEKLGDEYIYAPEIVLDINFLKNIVLFQEIIDKGDRYEAL